MGGYNGQIHIPLFKENKPGKVEDITLPVEEGNRYYLAKIDFEGVKLFRSSDFLGRLFQMQPGDVFSTGKLRDGLKNLTKVYSQFGYIDYVAEPQIDIVPNSNKINLTLNADEGKQFFVRRIGAEHDDARSHHPAADSHRRRRRLQLPALGCQHSAPESAGLFRNAQRE